MHKAIGKKQIEQAGFLFFKHLFSIQVINAHLFQIINFMLKQLDQG